MVTVVQMVYPDLVAPPCRTRHADIFSHVPLPDNSYPACPTPPDITEISNSGPGILVFPAQSSILRTELNYFRVRRLHFLRNMSMASFILCVQEVVSHFIQLAYYIKWVTTSWTYCMNLNDNLQFSLLQLLRKNVFETGATVELTSSLWTLLQRSVNIKIIHIIDGTLDKKFGFSNLD